MADTTRITVRVPDRDLALIDALVDTGEFTNRTAVVRRAIKDFLREQGDKVREGTEKEAALTEALLKTQEMQNQLREQQDRLEELMRK